MRLIDVDKINFFDCLAKTGDSICCQTKGIVSKDVVDEQPTVEAIPIEWIKRYIAEEGIYPNRELLSVEQADALERMIENWDKENEHNK